MRALLRLQRPQIPPVRLPARRQDRLARGCHYSVYFHQFGCFHQKHGDACVNGAAFCLHYLRSPQQGIHPRMVRPVNFPLARYLHFAPRPLLPDVRLVGRLPRRHVFSDDARHACLCAVF